MKRDRDDEAPLPISEGLYTLLLGLFFGFILGVAYTAVACWFL